MCYQRLNNVLYDRPIGSQWNLPVGLFMCRHQWVRRTTKKPTPSTLNAQVGLVSNTLLRHDIKRLNISNKWVHFALWLWFSHFHRSLTKHQTDVFSAASVNHDLKEFKILTGDVRICCQIWIIYYLSHQFEEHFYFSHCVCQGPPPASSRVSRQRAGGKCRK